MRDKKKEKESKGGGDLKLSSPKKWDYVIGTGTCVDPPSLEFIFIIFK